MIVSRCRPGPEASPSFRAPLWAVVCVSIALAACSGNTNAQASHPQQGGQAAPPVAVPTAPVVETTVRALPDFSPLVEKYGPAVVNVEVVEKAQPQNGPQGLSPNDPFYDFFRRFGIPTPDQGQRGNAPPARGAGSGFIVSADGYILTNTHVVGNADEVTVRLTDRREFPAKVIGADERTDVAVIKINATNLPTVRLGDPAKIKPGQWVLAIGSPFGFENSATAGIISATARSLPSDNYVPFIQTDVAVNPGNSGGPLFNLDGEVIGVNTAIISPSGGSIGIGFAVPSKTVAGVVDQLRQFGELRRGWLGVRIQSVTDEIAESLSIKPARGALVAGIDDKGPAKPAGIEPGDVVVKFDGKDVKDPKDLSRIVADTAVGKEVDVVIIRKGEEQTKKVTLGRLQDPDKVQAAVKTDEPAPEKPVTQKALGLDLAVLNKDLRARYKIKDSVKGVVVTNVDANSDAAEKRLSAGDVIVEVAQEAVASGDEIQKRIDQLKKDGKKSVLLLVSNGDGELRFVALSVQ